MSKKRKREPAEVIHASVLREQRWAYDRRRERLSWAQIADLSGKPVDAGGLGYFRSPKALRAAYEAHLEEVLELEEATRPAHLHHALDTLDAIEREQRSLAAVVDEAATAKARRAAEAEGKPPDEVDRIVILRDDRVRDAALKGLLSTVDRRVKLLGLDAPIAVDVTHHDATMHDLNAALERLGETPLPEPKKVPR